MYFRLLMGGGRCVWGCHGAV